MLKKMLVLCVCLSPLISNSSVKEISAFLEEQEIHCLADNIYNEARGEPLKGQVAVAMVTLNRKKSSNKSICDIVFEKAQFSWTNKFNYNFRRKETYKISYNLAKSVLNNKYKDPTNNSKFFHTTHINPHWASSMKLQAKIGNHVFYKE